jgi:flavodoxin I
MKTLIVFGSLLGKTKRIAGFIGDLLSQQGLIVDVKDVRDVSIDEINNYSLVLFGCSTWDDGVLQFDFRPFHKQLLETDFPGKKFGVFVLGSHKYPHPFGAANILDEAVNSIKGELVIDTLKLDIDHDESETSRDEEIVLWVANLITAIKS